MFHLFCLLFFILIQFSDTGGDPASDNFYKPTSIVWTASWSADDELVALGNDQGELVILETKGWKKIQSWKFPFTTIAKVEWNPHAPVLAIAATSYIGTRGIVQIYDHEKKSILRLNNDSLYGRALSWSPDGEQIAIAGAKARITIFNKKGELIRHLAYRNPHSIFDLDWHPEKPLLLAVEEDIYLIDIEKDSLIATLDDGEKNKGLLSCQWHPAGKMFVTGDYGHVNEGIPCLLKFWTPEGKLIKEIPLGKGEYRNLRWTADGKHLAAASDALFIFNEKGDLVSRFNADNENVWGLAWNKTGQKIISTSQKDSVFMSDLKGKKLESFSFNDK